MKIVYQSDVILPSEGADSVHVMNICNSLSILGVEVILIAKEGSIPEDIFSYYGLKKTFKILTIKSCNIRFFGGLIYGFKALSKIKKVNKINYIYSRSMHSLIWSKNLKIPFLFESHWKPHKKIYYFFQKLFFNSKNFKELIVISNHLRLIYEKLFPEIKGKIHVLHDASNMHILKRKRTNVEKLNIGYVGSLSLGQGYELIPELAKNNSKHNFHIYGGDQKKVDFLRDKYKLENLFIYGHIPHRDIGHEILKMDVMLAPFQKDLKSLGWASPMKIFEYMSYFKPIICSDFRVFREILSEKNSILVESNNIVSWSNAIKLLESKELRYQIASNAYHDFKNHYTWKKRAQKLYLIIKNPK